MLTPEDARLLVAKPESERLERKRAFSNAESVREAICAFANDMQRSAESGFVLLGVDDDGQLARLPVTDDLLLRLSALRDEGNILPLPCMEVYRMEIEPGVEIAVVEVASLAGRSGAIAWAHLHSFGSGIPAVHRTLKANGNPPPEFYLGDSSFGVNLCPRKDEA